jgi:hypothetical protein
MNWWTVTKLRNRVCSVACAAMLVMMLPATVQAATVNATVNAKFLKTLTLTSKQGFDFGTVLLPSSGSAVTLSVSRTGVLTCPPPLACSGTPKQAIFNVAGSNQQTVRIIAPAITLTNGTGGSLIFTPDVTASLTLTNSGSPGTDFGMGGSVSVSPTTPDGSYSGTITITADYQ